MRLAERRDDVFSRGQAWTDELSQALETSLTRVRTAGTCADSPFPVLSGGRACHSPWGCCAHKAAAGDVECGGRIRLAVCAREQRGSDIRTRVIGCVVRCAPFRRLRWQSTGNSGQGPLISLCRYALAVALVLCEGGAIVCRVVRSCRASVQYAITARTVCSGAVCRAIGFGTAGPLYCCGLLWAAAGLVRGVGSRGLLLVDPPRTHDRCICTRVHRSFP